MPKWKHHLFSLNNKLIRLFMKSDYPGWRKNVKIELQKLNKRKKIDVIISSFSPVDAHLIGLDFKALNQKCQMDCRHEGRNESKSNARI